METKISTADYVLACQAGDLQAAAQALIDMGQRPVLLRTDNTGSCKVPFDDGAWGRRLVSKRMETLERSIKRGLLGLGLGFQPTGNLAILDLDCPGKDRGRLPEVLAGAVALLFGGEVPQTFEVHGKGGSHLWFTISDNLRDKWAELGLGKKKIELATGGAVEVFMPTPDGQGQYQVATAPSAGKMIGAVRPITPMPASLEDYLIEKFCTVDAGIAPSLIEAGITSGARERFFTACIQQAVNGIVNSAEGTRHDTILKRGMMLAGYAVSLGQVHRRAECHEYAIEAARAVGRSENRAGREWEDGWEYGLGKPATVDHTKIAEYETARSATVQIKTGKNQTIKRGAGGAENDAGGLEGDRADDREDEGLLGSGEGAGGLEEALSVLRALANTLKADKQVWWNVGQAVSSRYGQEIADQVVETLRTELDIQHPEKGDRDKAGHKWTWKRFVKESREHGFKPAAGAASLDPADMADYILDQIALTGRIVFHNGLLYAYDNGKYRPRFGKGDYLRNLVTNLATPVFRQAEMYLTPKEVAAIVMHINAKSDITDRVTGLNDWIDRKDSDPDPADVIPVANGLLILKVSGGKPRLIPHSDRWFSAACGQVAYDPKAATPRRYLKLLEEIYEGDKSSITLELEMAGATLGKDAKRFHKMFVLFGESRCGKSLRMDIYGKMVGGFEPISISDIVKGNLEKAIGAAMIVIDEPNIKTMSTDAGHEVTSFLKSVTGHSPVSIPIKYESNYSGLLEMQIWVTSNPIFTGPDASGTFATRLIGNHHGVSWEGREDHGLQAEIEQELSGILRLIIIALRRLRRRKQFTDTKGTERIRIACRGVGSASLEWLDERIEFSGDYDNDALTIDELYDSYLDFCSRTKCGAKKRGNLKADLLQMAKIHYSEKPTWHKGRGKTGRFFTGIKLAPVETDDGGTVHFNRIWRDNLKRHAE